MTDTPLVRLFIGNLPRDVTRNDVERLFQQIGELFEIRLMNGFGFVEYNNAVDARDAVAALHGSDFMGQRLVVNFTSGSSMPGRLAQIRPRNHHKKEKVASRE
ncbi:hypothetical protein BU16DRAFT_529281 [Lophium mytilinum]|uniref:RRM domain-containing protein n=1 Tax=Lophium mytilinum TaxID=390894 RepID=A0A6A6QLV8_9PEZI|nr:hypothetical protein BU16DRAFT_529281 [Lophium mytilinum]